MSWPSVSFRSELPAVMRKELDQLSAQITGVLSPEHHADGTHGPITTPAIAVRGAATVGGALTVGGGITAGGNITTKGSIAADGNITTKGSLTAAGPVTTPTLQLGAGTPLTHVEEAIYVPRVLGHAGTPFVLGASSITGWYSQLGTVVTFEVRLVIGAGFVWAPGEVMVFTLPKVPASRHMAGETVLYTGLFFVGGGVIWDVPGEVTVLLSLPDVGGSVPGATAFVSETSPFAPAVGWVYGFFGTFRTTGAP